MGKTPPGTGPLSPDYSGLDPELMDPFITTFKTGADRIGQESEALRRLLERARLPATGLQPLAATLLWLDHQLPDLRRRSQAARAANALAPWRTGLLPFDESRLLPAGEARRQGAALADRFKAAPSSFGVAGNKPYDGELAALMAELDAHRDDPEFTAAFFARLGADGTRRIVGKLKMGMRDYDAAIDVVSRAFGTAVRAGDIVTRSRDTRAAVLTGTDVPGFAKVKRELAQETGHVGDESLGYLLRAGDFPPAWLAGVVKRHALGNNPAAARLAISAATEGGVPLSRLLRDLHWRTRTSLTSGEHAPDAANAFGRMLAAAAGAYDEKDGAHSPEAAKFAFDLMRALPDLEDPKLPADMRLQEPTRVHLAEIAGAYATEITEGANLGDSDRTQASQFGPVTSNVAGSEPSFRLSPEDTYAFVKLFANTPENLKPFAAGMGALSDRLVRVAAQADGGRGIEHLQRAMAALGYAAGMQFAAERSVQGKLDQQDKEFREGQLAYLGFLVNAAGIAVPLEGQAMWLVLSAMASEGLDSLTEVGETRLDALDDRSRLATLAKERWLADMLMANGFKPKVSAADERFNNPPITDENGRLLPFEKLVQDKPALRNLNDWLIANGSGGTDWSRLGEAVGALDVIFRGARDKAMSAERSGFD
ncbi:hypothetical protein [Nonomuraea zeae]|uniref:Uncharacterized protein n=1 Tax=Nonomuraea zeae TaxID=1642303 RepID=A0A5S4FTE1_9ACTN|nr:hypothetical protein [Nonomuraea zeae]TMR23892.1 hypothetical protein ETD85_47350 [Nonomuraea zeae]